VQIKLIIILYVLWSERNVVNIGERVKSIDKVCYQISRYISDFLESYTKKDDKPTQQRERWKKLPYDYLKINIDGAFFQ
jgi:hypothetical protein